MAKSKKIATEAELIKYLNNFGIAKHLKFFTGIIIEDPIKRRSLKFKFKLDGTSFTDGKDIVIGVPRYLIGHTKEEILSSLKAMTGHECEHINSTPMNLYKDFIQKFATYFNDKHGIHKSMGNHIGNYLANVIEDGRIERLLIKRAPGLLNSLLYFRSLWWLDNATLEYDPKSDMTEEQKEFFDTLFVFCTFATMGQYPCDYPTFYSEELCDMMRNLKPEIFKAVDSDDYVESTNYIWQAIYKIEDWLVEKMNLFPEPVEFDSKFNKERGGDFGELSEENTTTGELPSGAISSEPIEPKGDDKDDDKGDEKGDENSDNKNGVGNPLYEAFDNGKFDTEENMKSVIEKAMKNSETEVHKELYDTIIQADFDDLSENKREKEEALKSTTNLSAEELKIIKDLYSSLNRSWNIPLKIHTFQYDALKAPDDVRLEGKKFSKEFEEIFLNKNSGSTKNKKRGTLDTTSLWKLSVNETNIFQKKGRPNDTDYVFYMLMDGSGSMNGEKYIEALRATSVLEESLSKFAPVKITQFDSNHKLVNHYVIKDFDDNKKEKNYSWTFANHMKADNCNMDGYSIRVALAEIKKRPERKKVLIILSDGYPSGAGCYYGDDAEKDVKNAIREGRKDNVDIFNIMFGSEKEREQMLPTFKYMYEKCIVSCGPKDITKTLLRIVKKELKK